jgi:hypothetical protein
MASAETLVDHIATLVRTRLPPGVIAADLDGFLARNRAALVALVDQQLAARAGRTRTGTSSPAEHRCRCRQVVPVESGCFHESAVRERSARGPTWRPAHTPPQV